MQLATRLHIVPSLFSSTAGEEMCSEGNTCSMEQKVVPASPGFSRPDLPRISPTKWTPTTWNIPKNPATVLKTEPHTIFPSIFKKRKITITKSGIELWLKQCRSGSKARCLKLQAEWHKGHGGEVPAGVCSVVWWRGIWFKIPSGTTHSTEPWGGGIFSHVHA